jgi:hypothetical protein
MEDYMFIVDKLLEVAKFLEPSFGLSGSMLIAGMILVVLGWIWILMVWGLIEIIDKLISRVRA